MNPHQRRGSNRFLTGGAAVCVVVAAQSGCMPDFDAITSKWHPESGAGGKGGKGGTSAGSGGSPSEGGIQNGGMPSAGKADGGKAHGGASNRGGHGGAGGTGIDTGGTSLGGEAGVENGGNAGAEGGAPGTGGRGGAGGSTSGTGGTSPNGGEAGAVCEPGFTTCPGSGECSTSLSVGDTEGATVNNCGSCGFTCSTVNADSAACASGVCHPTCSPGFADCTTSANDGCETDETTVAACGSCTHACSTTGAATRACASGACAPVCAARWLDCTVDDGSAPDDGCETYADTLTSCGATCSAAGTACNPDQVCNVGVCGAAAGLVTMSIPFTASGQGQRFADVFSGPDLTGATVTVRMYAPGATNGYLQTFLTDNSNPTVFGPMVTTDFSVLSAGWTDIVVFPGQPATSFDAADVHQVSFDFYTGASGSNPITVYLDAVWSSGLQVTDTFDSTTQTMVASTRLVVDGSSFGWVASMP